MASIREKLKDIMLEAPYLEIMYDVGELVDYLIDNGVTVADAPTADVVEVKKGRWERPTRIGGMTVNLPHCSICGEVPCDEGKFCPNCGADMRGDTDGINR